MRKGLKHQINNLEMLKNEFYKIVFIILLVWMSRWYSICKRPNCALYAHNLLLQYIGRAISVCIYNLWRVFRYYQISLFCLVVSRSFSSVASSVNEEIHSFCVEGHLSFVCFSIIHYADWLILFQILPLIFSSHITSIIQHYFSFYFFLFLRGKEKFSLLRLLVMFLVLFLSFW